jgi:hypothetical protein
MSLKRKSISLDKSYDLSFVWYQHDIGCITISIALITQLHTPRVTNFQTVSLCVALLAALNTTRRIQL